MSLFLDLSSNLINGFLEDESLKNWLKSICLKFNRFLEDNFTRKLIEIHVFECINNGLSQWFSAPIICAFFTVASHNVFILTRFLVVKPAIRTISHARMIPPIRRFPKQWKRQLVGFVYSHYYNVFPFFLEVWNCTVPILLLLVNF